MRKAERREIDKMCEAHKLCLGSAPVSAPWITCNFGKTWAERLVDGTGSGNRAGETPPTVGVDSFGSWRTKRAEERGRLFFAASGANRCGYGSGAGFTGGERLAQRPEGGPPQG